MTGSCLQRFTLTGGPVNARLPAKAAFLRAPPTHPGVNGSAHSLNAHGIPTRKRGLSLELIRLPSAVCTRFRCESGYRRSAIIPMRLCPSAAVAADVAAAVTKTAAGSTTAEKKCFMKHSRTGDTNIDRMNVIGVNVSQRGVLRCLIRHTNARYNPVCTNGGDELSRPAVLRHSIPL